MTIETKNMYRKQIERLAKKNKKDEYQFSKDLMSAYKDNQEHIGFRLFKNKQKYNFSIYITILVTLTLLLSFILSNYFIKPRIFGFIILLIPTSQIIKDIINQIVSIFVKPKPLFKMDYSKKIPDKCKTMVVVPTIISNTDKIKDIFDQLETLYIANKTNNLYFTLLGDVKQSSSKVLEIDDEISKFGSEVAKALNKKYKKDIFFFVYRKRVYNKNESSYLGYERKRGALVQFNKLLLHSMSKTDEEKYFNVNTLNGFNEKIKYVVTLDTDTKLVLNTLVYLIGCMNHPMNRPILNNENTKVISGYGIMQPRVNVDLESTNKSLYSQIFAGFGGFDAYSSLVPNFNQDLFNEGSFIGKGIYDLEVFDKVLSERFRDNLVLSHDLLEGNYLRCGYVSDVEFIEEFPSKFLVDSTRKHRWARGDIQIISYLCSKVKNKKLKEEKNPLTLYEKWKIFTNIKDIFMYPMLFLLIISIIFLTNNKILFLLVLIFTLTFPSFIFIKNKLYKKMSNNKTVYYNNLMYGSKALFLRVLTIISIIPYYTKLYLDAFFRTIYRLAISKRHLLEWVTAEDAEKKMKFDLCSYIYKFLVNIVVAISLIIIGIIYNNILSIIFGTLFLLGPLLIYLISADQKYEPKRLDDKANNALESIAKRTWNYFKENLTEENNYLIPDNFQELRDEKFDIKTSPTNIGFSLTSVIAAYELKFISLDDTIDYLEKILISVDSLKKWNGHLYNWYNIKTKEVMYPKFISTVDSGNLIASIMLTRGFLLDKSEKLVKLCDKLIKNANFKKLYSKLDVFSIGYETSENSLSIYNYNKFASESRLTSFISIVKEDVLAKHWFCLDKTLTEHNHKKGLTSWNGSAFEYFMPLLFMKNYPNTLLDEAYTFAFNCQKEYIRSIDKNLPWGISEAAYNELDNGENYKYKAFSVPFLKAKEEKSDRIVISPYSSLMVLELFPDDVYKNVIRMKQMNMLFKYGFYESYDYNTKNVVRACYAHHQGMSLMGITNYLTKNSMKDYFHKNVRVKTFEILLKEKVQLKANIDIKIAGYKKYNYEKENIENDIRTFKYISDMPEVSAISNRKYTLLMNDRGNSFSRYRTLQLNRYRKVTEQDYGMFLYIRDIATNKVWSNTYAPTNVEADYYEVTFSSDKIKYVRQDGLISTKTEIIVTPNDNAEIRKITFTNESSDFKILELTTYTEPILSENTDDVSHKAFNNIFLETTFDKKTNSYIAIRKSRETKSKVYMLNRLIIPDTTENYTYENDRLSFIGRNNTVNNPDALYNELQSSDKTSIDSILSIRNKIEIPPNSKKEVYFIAGFGRSMEQINKIIDSYNSKNSINKAFNISSFMNKIITKNMNLTGKEMNVYNTMLNYLYQTTKISIKEERKKDLIENALSQRSLWKFGVSGDRPIILVNISSIENIAFVYDILKAFEYFKNKSIFVDIIIINSEEDNMKSLLNKVIEDEKYRMYTENSFSNTPGSITVIDSNDINEDEKSLLKIVPRLKFNITDNSSLTDEVNLLEAKNKINRLKPSIIQSSIKSRKINNLDYYNEYGGFDPETGEYVITNKDTPAPWSNVISNGSFGTIITNNGCGYTYGYNSSEFKITSWTNEMVVNDKSEGIKINNEIFDPTICRHGFGYSILESETENLRQELTEFVSVTENVKVFILKLKNKYNKVQNVDLSFFINPTLGNFEEKTARHILSEYMKNENYLKLRNVYSINYSDVTVFLSSSEKILSATADKILVKDINTSVKLKAKEEKEIVFTLGCAKGDLDTLTLVYKYKKFNEVEKELEKVKAKWKNELSKIKVKTSDKSFDYMMNGWYLYQVMSSRIFAKAGFYQVSGAFGFRDQLQDCMNICFLNPEITRRQILKNASHQFMEGDVLHWWHDENNFGLRSRYKDDYLWLVYATLYYLEVTEDYSILNEEVPFVLGDRLTKHEKERGMTFIYSNSTKSLFDHLLLSLKLSMSELGSHNLPLMGGGDWNDGMNLVGIKGKGESVWLGFFLYDILDKFIKLIKKKYKDIGTTTYEKFNEKLKENLNKYGWDKEYYLRAYFDNGDKLGSSENDECKIDLISQSFSILSNVIEAKNIGKVINSVEENLVDKDNKLIKLLTPPFKKSLNIPGYIMNYKEGIRENGGQYTHATAWYIMALQKTNYIDRAYDYYQMINPINRTNTKKDVLKYMIEPYVISADIYSNEGLMGHGGWSWYTGSAGWFYKIGIEEVLGIKKRGKYLYIDPHIPSTWKGFEVVYNYNETIYNLKIVVAKEHKITIDKKLIKDKNRILLNNNKKIYNVVVYIKGGKGND